MLETDVATLLANDPGVLAALGGADNVYLGMIPKGEPDNPAVVIQAVNSIYYKGADRTNGFQIRRLQIDSYAARYSDALTLSNAVRDALKDFSGATGKTQIQGTILRQDMDMPDEPGSTGYVFRRMLIIEFFFTEL
jgi:hypothetical protein